MFTNVFVCLFIPEIVFIVVACCGAVLLTIFIIIFIVCCVMERKRSKRVVRREPSFKSGQVKWVFSIDEQAHEILVLMVFSCNEGLSEHVQMRKLPRPFTAHINRTAVD